ncbi:GntR family transcriptional regulator [Roseomonas elaeocarpi]|uniref:GntR family transcriptional regulator n=1 Tax=Roseomonas elaeocarpi TaxID=907779 RepID=A0ABV6JRW6_9PROT
MNDVPLPVAPQVVTLRSALEETLRAAILGGRFQPGERLPERELCALTGASRASVREALRGLEGEGLVTIRPHRGPSVTAIRPDEARELYGVRGVLQGYAARLCATLQPEPSLRAIEGATEALETAAAAGDTRAVVAAGDSFYAAIAEGSGSGVLRQLLLSVHNRLFLLRSLAMARPARVQAGIAAYRAIRDAIVAGEARLAEELCLRHSEDGAALALQLLRDAEEARDAGLDPRRRAAS